MLTLEKANRLGVRVSKSSTHSKRIQIIKFASLGTPRIMTFLKSLEKIAEIIFVTSEFKAPKCEKIPYLRISFLNLSF